MKKHTFMFFLSPLFAKFNVVNEIVIDTDTGLIWQKTYVSSKKWQEALDYCENLIYAGYSDWRLPNKDELITLINYDRVNPASDFPNMPSRSFWSSTTKTRSTDEAWEVDFSEGNLSSNTYHLKTSHGNVRCVR